MAVIFVRLLGRNNFNYIDSFSCSMRNNLKISIYSPIIGAILVLRSEANFAE